MLKAVDKFRAVISGLRRPAGSRSMSERPVAGAAPRALAVMGGGPDRDTLQRVFRDAGWELVVADTSASAIACQEKEPLPIILYERELRERSWRQAVCFFSRLSPRPCVILLSRCCDKNLWDELVRCGGFDLLRTPVDRVAVIQTVRAGWSIWQNQHAPGNRRRETASRASCDDTLADGVEDQLRHAVEI
jgi:DNA-binding NtrC family response regulator